MKKFTYLMMVLMFAANIAQATEQDRTTGKAGVTANITDNSAGDITPAKLRTELNDLWDSSVLQGELETLVDPIIDAAMVGGETGTANEYLYTPTDGTCTDDMSTEFEAFLQAHDGILIQKAGTCIRLDDGGKSTNYAFESSTDIFWRCEVAGQCQAGNINDKNVIQYYVPDGIALDSKTLVSSVQANPTAAINKDDVVSYAVVASTAGYNVGDTAKLVDSVPLPNRLGSTKTITDVAWNGTACVVTTSSSHGYSDSQNVGIKGVTGTGQIDVLDGSDGFGRQYNVTSLSSTTFSLQTLDNSTGSSVGSAVDCSTGAYSSGGLTYRTATWTGEDVKVAGVDAVQNRIYFANPLGYGALYVQSPVLYRYTQARKVDIRGIEFVSIGDTGDLSIDTSDASVDILGVPRAIFDDIKCYDTWDACLILRSTPHSIVRNIRSNLLRNRGTSDPSGSPRSITDISVAAEAVLTSAAHGYSNNTVVVLDGMPNGFTSFDNKGCVVSNVTTDTFKCKDTYGNYFDSTSFTPAFAGSSTAVEAADVTGLGYTVSINSGNLGTIIDGIYTEEGRHGVTTDGSALSWKATLSNTDSQVARFGVPTYATIQNGVCQNGNGVCWDEHEEAFGLTWRNLTCTDANRGPDFGSYKGRCMQFRGDGSTIDEIIVDGGQKGLRFPPSDWFRDRHFTIGSVQCLETSTLQDTQKNQGGCVEFGNVESGSYSSYTNTAYFDVESIKSIGVPQPVWMDKRVSVKIGTLDIQDYDDGVDCGAGAYLDVKNVYSSHANPEIDPNTWAHVTDVLGNGFNIVNMKSDGTYNGCTARLGDVHNTQGTGTDELQDIFEAADATATKNWYLGTYTEHDPNGIGAARITEATSGFTQLTTSSVVFVENPAIVANDNAFAYLSSVSADAGSTLVLTGQGASSQGVEIDPNNNGGTFEFRFRPDVFRFTPEDSTSASARVQFNRFADTSVATGEASYMTLGSAVTVTHDTGSYSNQRDNRIICPTHAYDGASTVDDAYCVEIGEPTAGANATFTRSGSLSLTGKLKVDEGVYGKKILTTLDTGGAASTPVIDESGTMYINTGATTLTNVTLPGANVSEGSVYYHACVLDTDGIRFTAASGDVIRYAATVSGSGGYIQSTTIGDCFTLHSTDTTNWLVTSAVGAGIAVSP